MKDIGEIFNVDPISWIDSLNTYLFLLLYSQYERYKTEKVLNIKSHPAHLYKCYIYISEKR